MEVKKGEQGILMNTMLEKSQDCFLLAIELFNKPTISLTTDGFVIFICNAWELLFKAYFLKKRKSIYYSKNGKKTNVTLSLSTLIKKVLTNDKDPARINLEIVSGIRNKATHLIIPEYATSFHGVFLSCCKNYVSKLDSFFSINIGDKLKSDFLSMTIPSTNSSIDIVGKYGKTISKQFTVLEKFVNKTLVANAPGGTVPSALSLSYTISFKTVKKLEDASLTMAKHKKEDSDVEYVEVIKPSDPSETHPLNRKKVLELINNQLHATGISFVPYTLNKNTTFTSDTFNLYIKSKNIKSDKHYTYEHKIGKTSQYTYSESLVEKIIQDITDDPDIFCKCKKKN